MAGHPPPQTFRYLHDINYSWRVVEPSPCIVCGQERPGYGLLVVDDEEEETPFTVCEPCLVSGRLEEMELAVNDADAEALLQAQQQKPQHSLEQQQTVVAERTAEVERRTPRPIIFNAFTWPVHCDDYLVLHRPAVADDLEELAPDGDGKAFLASHLHPDCAVYADEEFLGNVWGDRLSGFLRFYLWQCSTCAEYVLTYDSD